MVRTRKGSVVAGAGAVAFGILTVLGNVVGGAPGGNYTESDVATYASIGHLPAVILSGYGAIFGVLGLICVLAYLREMIGADPDRGLAAGVFWGAGLAAAASFAVGWGLTTGIAVAAAEGGAAAATVSRPTLYVLSDTVINVLYGSGGAMLGFALVALMIGSRGILPSWLRWLNLVAGVLAVTAPFYFSAPAIPIWAVAIGVWLLIAGRVPVTTVASRQTA